AARASPSKMRAQVAQLVEHVTENHGVGGSIPPLGTILLSYKRSSTRAVSASPCVLPSNRSPAASLRAHSTAARPPQSSGGEAIDCRSRRRSSSAEKSK